MNLTWRHYNYFSVDCDVTEGERRINRLEIDYGETVMDSTLIQALDTFNNANIQVKNILDNVGHENVMYIHVWYIECSL